MTCFLNATCIYSVANFYAGADTITIIISMLHVFSDNEKNGSFLKSEEGNNLLLTTTTMLLTTLNRLFNVNAIYKTTEWQCVPSVGMRQHD